MKPPHTRLQAISTAALVPIATTLLIFGCGGPERDPAPPRLVILYATCTLNRSYLSPYAPDVEFTPHLEAFGRESIVFTKHATESGISGISFASIFSGTQAMQHGVYFHPDRLPDDLYLITEAFGDAGYETFFFGGHGMASPELNYAQGVEPENLYWQKPKLFEKHERFLKAEDPRFEAILDRLAKDPDYRAFVVTNFTVTHAFYAHEHVPRFCRQFPERCAGLGKADIERYRKLFKESVFRWVNNFDEYADEKRLSVDQKRELVRTVELLYASNVFYLDELFGAVVEKLRTANLLGESLIAFTADHGEVLSRENADFNWVHGSALAPEVLQVPWILHAPGLEPGRYESVTRSIDLFPTLAGLAGVPLQSAELMGVDLSQVLRDRGTEPRLLAYSHTALRSTHEGPWPPRLSTRFPYRDPSSMWVSVRDQDVMYKLTSDDGTSFEATAYNWESDPEERVNIYDPENASHRAIIERLQSYKVELVKAYRPEGAEPAVAPDRAAELLRTLGYIE